LVKSTVLNAIKVGALAKETVSAEVSMASSSIKVLKRLDQAKTVIDIHKWRWIKKDVPKK
jgi:hypothetical protein